MKRAPFTYGIDRSGKTYWRSLGELGDSPEFRNALEQEFPEGALELKDGVNRRQFLSLMGASLGLAGLTACRRPEEKILPFSRSPEHVVPGAPLFYATALPLMGTAVGVLVESHDGRPTKIEGNPRHPDSLGAANAFVQASILDLYDPDRSTAPRGAGAPSTWEQAQGFLVSLGERLRKAQGRGLAVLTEAHRSPTLARVLAELRRAMPQAKLFRYEPFSRDHDREGARLAFGRPLQSVLHLGRARVIAALDSDLLGLERSPIKQSMGFAKGRRVEKPGDEMNRLYAVESTFTLTGASADHRLRLARREIGPTLFALAHELATRHGVDLGAAVVPLLARFAPAEKSETARFVRALAADLAAHRGKAAVVVGLAQPPAVHAVAHLLNHALNGAEGPVRYVRPFEEGPEGRSSLEALGTAIDAGEVESILILGGNPVFDAPAATRFAERLAKVPTRIHLSTHVDETSEASSWHLNRAHFLESWGDLRAEDGTGSIVQPLIAPLFGGRTDAEVAQLLLGEPKKAHELVQATWRESQGAGFELAWRRALHDGLWEGSAFQAEAVQPQPEAVASALASAKSPAGQGLELTFHADSHAFDGRFANNGWLLEMPDPMTKLTWDNAALVAPATAARLGLSDGQVVELAAGGRKVEAPVLLAPGQAEDSIALAVGQGRRTVGRVGKGAGFDAYPLREGGELDAVSGATLTKTARVAALARTQEHNAMEGRPLIREATLAKFAQDPEFAKKQVEHPPLKSIFADFNYDGHRWGMVIDLSACTGCNACMVACQAENNIPLVGKSGVLRSREMHWIRVDRYFEGDSADSPRAAFQPIGCQQCENAPCEQVCPVGATTHSAEGLNDMAYNRCVGTRYCANNCPYKVRRFNFFNYTKDTPELRKLQHNPDVSVRTRGVMEKCTYCVQRIQHAKIEAHKAGRDRVKDGAVVTACQQTCPAQAIVFGDLGDKDSEVSRRAALPRDYRLLEELNVRPRTSFLARVRNPNPELEGA